MQIDRTVVESSRKDLKIVVSIYSLPANLRKNDNKRRGITLFLVHGSGFHKEIWEPIIQKLFSYKSSSWYVEKAIAFDAVNHGDSAILNREKLANEHYTPWFIHARDIIAIVRQLQRQNICLKSPQSIIGIGHSWGADALLLSESICPLTFSCLVATEAILHLRFVQDHAYFAAVRKRRWTWKNEDDAKEYFTSRKFFNSWDKRCLELYIKHGMESVDGKLALKCRPHNEAAVYAGGDYPAMYATLYLWKIRCPTAFLIGGKSVQCPFKYISKITECMPDRRLSVMDNAGHLLVLENPDLAAEKYSLLLDEMVPRAHARLSLDICKAKL
ncbi:hypothetical protein J3B02_002471 [Coemansia erecta]|uniref:AB hydrolase-1 domain-containing protein n=1 Tax=Coemansia asiatica TaxID=1052880 RepID=A0A9W7XLF6_9FUNG|nr:hypothetical protein LPJ64_003594 [Coemansia asiatica]KAJ2854856.1 hypothetical protein J3B02_002471 [Coemansia erecta]KAJ2883891.1 hypothetical protein FB639_002073 [Coemansia asiatica]